VECVKSDRLPCRSGGRWWNHVAVDVDPGDAGGWRKGARPRHVGGESPCGSGADRRSCSRRHDSQLARLALVVLGQCSSLCHWPLSCVFLAWRMLQVDTLQSRPRLDIGGILLLSPGILGVLWGLSNASKLGGVLARGRARPHAHRRRPPCGVRDLRDLVGRASACRRAPVRASCRRLRLRPTLSLRSSAVRGAAPAAAVLSRCARCRPVGRRAAPRSAGNRHAPQPQSGWPTHRQDRTQWVSLVGFTIVGAATAPFTFASVTTNEWLLMAALLVRRFGLGAVTIPLMTAAFVGLERTDVPHASILTRISQQVGGSFGVARFPTTPSVCSPIAMSRQACIRFTQHGSLTPTTPTPGRSAWAQTAQTTVFAAMICARSAPSSLWAPTGRSRPSTHARSWPMPSCGDRSTTRRWHQWG
jgi:hypothetical protein